MTLEQEFRVHLIELAYRIKKETHGSYNPTEFLWMVETKGGVETAHDLLITPHKLSSGYERLWELDLLHLTLEAQILENKKYHSLFTEKELKTCQNRLKDYK